MKFRFSLNFYGIVGGAFLLCALFRTGDVWNLFVVEDGRARLRQVEVGQRTPLAAEIKSGVEADDEVIVHPANEITDGTRVEPRQQEYHILSIALTPSSGLVYS